MDMGVSDLRELSGSWLLALRSDRKAPSTLTVYELGVRMYLAWCEACGADPLVRAALRGWTAELLENGAAAATAAARQRAVKLFAQWLADEGEIREYPFLGIKAPKLDQKVIEPLSDDQLRAMLKACQPPAGLKPLQALPYRRDEAMLRLMLESAVRAGEVVGMTMDDLDIMRGLAVIRRGKGGKGRIVPFGPHTASALDRYLRTRRHHKLAAGPMLWLGAYGKGFGYDSLHQALARRAKDAGVPSFHPHLLRHTASHRWLAAGGSTDGLMTIAGWTQPAMMHRYTKARASARAADEARGLNLGDL